MCLIINKKFHINNKALIAKKDIYTLKVVIFSSKNSCLSYFKKANQNFNKLLRSRLKRDSVLWNTNIEKGLHSIIESYSSMFIGDRFDSSWRKLEIVLCKIPKGSIYYIGTRGDIVSNQLINIEVLVANKLSDIKLEEKTRISSINGAITIAYGICKSYGIKIGI